MPANLSIAAESHKVYLKEFWEDDWEEVADLYCNHCAFTAAPTIASAELERRYGPGKRQSDAAPIDVPFFDCVGWWVKIELIPWDEQGAAADPIVWVGVITELGDSPAGSGPATKPAGNQKMLAYGAEIFLDRTKIDRSYFSSGGAAVRVNRGLTFNRQKRARRNSHLDKSDYFERAGNRSADPGEDGLYLFAGDDTSDDCWSTYDMVVYLLKYLVPRDAGDELRVPITLGTDAFSYLPGWDKPVVATDGRPLRDVLGELMDRRRLLGYTVEFDPVSEEFTLRPFTYADQQIDLGDNRFYIESQNQTTLAFDDDVDVETCHIKESDTQRYDQVVAVGQRIVCCGTISAADSTLVGQWSDDEHIGYYKAASEQADYADLDIVDKVERDRVARASEQFRRVYSYFGLPADWNGQVGDGVGGTQYDLLPESLFVTPQEGDTNWYMPELRFLHELPLKTDHDYTDANIRLDTVADNTPDGAEWDFRPVYAIIRLPDEPTGPEEEDRYAEIDKIGLAADAECYGDGAGRDFSCSLRVQRDAPGVIIRVHGGLGQHSIASIDFTPLDNLYDPPGVFDWHELNLTVAMEADCRVASRWPTHLDEEIENPKILRIDVSRMAGLHYVANGTVVGLIDGVPQRTTGGTVRDDRFLLDAIVQAAYQWYGRRRAALTLTRHGLKADLRVGDLITEIGSGATAEPIRTVVTEVRYDLATKDRETHRTTIQTQWAELDVLKLF